MQGALDEIDPDAFALRRVDTDSAGYRAPVVTQIVGVTYRQLDYWARTKLLEPSVRSAQGSGSQRLYSFRDILVLRLIKSLLAAGISLPQIRKAVEQVRDRGASDLASTTLFSDGTTIFECTSESEVFDLLRGGQGVFGIAVGPALSSLVGEIGEFPSESADSDAPTPSRDDLAARRAAKSA